VPSCLPTVRSVLFSGSGFALSPGYKAQGIRIFQLIKYFVFSQGNCLGNIVICFKENERSGAKCFFENLAFTLLQ
jgi:hypothetical protein